MLFCVKFILHIFVSYSSTNNKMKEKMLDHIYELFVLADNIEDIKERTEYITKLGDVEYIVKNLNK